MKEFPRPDFRRRRYVSLSGKWAFAFDANERGECEHWEREGNFTGEITVPYVYQAKLSGVESREMVPVVWYARHFDVPEHEKEEEPYLYFGAADWRTDVYLNGARIARHEGGYTPFSVSIAPWCRDRDNLLVVRCEDRPDAEQPRGKQYWKDEPDRCWYSPSTGIWQDVFLGFRPGTYIENIHTVTDVDNSEVTFTVRLNRVPEKGAEASFRILFRGREVVSCSRTIDEREESISVSLVEEDYVDDEHSVWSPEHPNLYDYTCTLSSEDGTDVVSSYFGMRKIGIHNGHIVLNNRPFYQRIVLDQGYWRDGLYTPESHEDLEKDILLMKEAGFNSVRMHQKIEDPWFYYYADIHGMAVWGEMPSAYRFSGTARRNTMHEMEEFIERDWNHPSIIIWVPLNESWGVRNIYSNRAQMEYASTLYRMVKAMDSTRLVSTNDGWEAQSETDVVGVHDYSCEREHFLEKYGDLREMMKGASSHRLLASEGYCPEDKPVLMTEFGGTAFASCVGDGAWGYSGAVESGEEYLDRLRMLTSLVRDTDMDGFCWTQFTDVFQEVNGLFDMDRNAKCAIEEYQRIFGPRS